MKKYSMLVYHKEYIKFLENLQKLGVVHVIEKESGEIENLELQKKHLAIKEISKAIKFLEGREVEISTKKGNFDSEEILTNLRALQEEQEIQNQQLAGLKKELSIIEPWGDFSWKSIHKLKESGLEIKFFTCSTTKFENEIKDTYPVELINTEGSHSYFVLFEQHNKETELDAEEISLPTNSLSQIKQLIDSANEALLKIDEDYDNYAVKYLNPLKKIKTNLLAELSFDKVILNTEKQAEEKLMFLEGWVPNDKENEVNLFLDENGIYFESEKPKIEETAPIKLKNNKFAKLYEAIGELYTFPDYKEIDLTPFFAPFFMLFFGFCLGDAGYGLLILIATIIGFFKVKPSLKPIMKLGMLLGISTVIMGIVSGTLLGIKLLDVEWIWIQKYKAIMLDDKKLMALALALGYIQVVFGMFIKAFNKIRMYGIEHGISQFGWIIIVLIAIPAYIGASEEIIATDIGYKIALISGIIGGIPAIFYNSPGKNIFLNLGLGVWDTYGMASGLLGDILSYIRLFALGISSAVLGKVFNDLAFDLSPDNKIIGPIVIALILVFGHCLNLFMAALGSFVHPLRLTFVEFYKNAGFMGGGKKYQPFTK